MTTRRSMHGITRIETKSENTATTTENIYGK